MEFKNIKYIIVGSGFFGAVIAERIANILNENVVIVEKRDHPGGNCFSDYDKETNINYHKYGTHIFHTPNKHVWDYLNNFSQFNNYVHQVLTEYNGTLYQLPINLNTINKFYNINIRPFEVDDFLKKEILIDNIIQPKNLEEKAISLIGKSLYKAFIYGYTKKQWNKEPNTLPESIINRLPFRKNYNNNYFFDKWQGLPLDGYTPIFDRMLNNKKIELLLNTDFFDIKNKISDSTKIIYSGPIDRYFNNIFGKLEYISLDFEKEILDVDDYQGNSVINYADASIPYTRIHEFKHLHPEKEHLLSKTLLYREYPKHDINLEPYYPVIDNRNIGLFNKYYELSKRQKNVFFGGRLGNYKYFDIHHTIENALNFFEKTLKNNNSDQGKFSE